MYVWGDTCPPLEENADLPYFTPESTHLLLWGVYEDCPHHKDGLPLDGGVVVDTIWQRCWRRLATQCASWYDTPSGTLGRRFTATLDVEWWGVLGRT